MVTNDLNFSPHGREAERGEKRDEGQFIDTLGNVKDDQMSPQMASSE